MSKGNGKQMDRRPRILVLEGLSGGSWAVEKAGGNAHSISPQSLKAVEYALGTHPDGILLTGGGDVDPKRYGQKAHKEVYGVSEQRDFVESLVLSYARRAEIPVMGICRGAQIMNVEAGGTLKQHILGHSSTWHRVTASSWLKSATGRRRFYVTSLHHQCVGKVAPGYSIVARALDGTPEAIASSDGRCIGVQFHPEMDDKEDYSIALFRWLITESAKRAKLPEPDARPNARRTYSWERDDDEWGQVYTKPTLGTGNTGAWVKDDAGKWVREEDYVIGSLHYSCWDCGGMEFDDDRDYEDHEWMVHGRAPESNRQGPFPPRINVVANGSVSLEGMI